MCPGACCPYDGCQICHGHGEDLFEEASEMHWRICKMVSLVAFVAIVYELASWL